MILVNLLLLPGRLTRAASTTVSAARAAKQLEDKSTLMVPSHRWRWKRASTSPSASNIWPQAIDAVKREGAEAQRLCERVADLFTSVCCFFFDNSILPCLGLPPGCPRAPLSTLYIFIYLFIYLSFELTGWWKNISLGLQQVFSSGGRAVPKSSDR